MSFLSYISIHLQLYSFQIFLIGNNKTLYMTNSTHFSAFSYLLNINWITFMFWYLKNIYILCGPILPCIPTMWEEGPGPILRVRGNWHPRMSSRGMDKITVRGEVEHICKEWAVSENDGRLGTSVRSAWRIC